MNWRTVGVRLDPVQSVSWIYCPSAHSLSLAIRTSDTDINERWPQLLPILSKVWVASHSYDDVAKVLKTEEDKEPIVDYMRVITYLKLSF